MAWAWRRTVATEVTALEGEALDRDVRIATLEQALFGPEGNDDVLADFATSLDNVNNALDDLATTDAELSLDFETVNAGISSLETDVTSLETDVTSLETDVTALEGEVYGVTCATSEDCGAGETCISLVCSGSVRSQVDSAQTSITSLQTDVTTIEGNTVLALDDYLTLGATNGYLAAVFIGINVQIVNGSGLSTTANGLGNLIVGYNLARTSGNAVCSIGTQTTQVDCEAAGNIWSVDHKSGSHNIVGGQANAYSRYGGIVLGDHNAINGERAVVLGGFNNVSSGLTSVVVAGTLNQVTAWDSVVVGGTSNTASGKESVVVGGGTNTASGANASVLAGSSNTASGAGAAVVGGTGNDALATESVGVGGRDNTLYAGQSVVLGGYQNTASGATSTVAGGNTRTAAGTDDAVIGSAVYDN
jgi:hypothetical protein